MTSWLWTLFLEILQPDFLDLKNGMKVYERPQRSLDSGDFIAKGSLFFYSEDPEEWSNLSKDTQLVSYKTWFDNYLTNQRWPGPVFRRTRPHCGPTTFAADIRKQLCGWSSLSPAQPLQEDTSVAGRYLSTCRVKDLDCLLLHAWVRAWDIF